MSDLAVVQQAHELIIEVSVSSLSDDDFVFPGQQQNLL